MKKSVPLALLALSLLCGCTAPAPAETPAPTPAAEMPPSPEPTENPAFAWLGDQEQERHYSALDGLDHMPLDQLPQEVLDSLEMTEETIGFDGFYSDDWGFMRTYMGPGLEVHTTAPSAAYIEHLRQSFAQSGEYYFSQNDICTDAEDFEARIAGEADREWITWVMVTDDRFATLEGLKVGMTVTEAEGLGYPLTERRSFAGGFGPSLSVRVEEDKVTALSVIWDMGRYIGKFWEM